MISTILYVLAFISAVNGALLVILGLQAVRWRSQGVPAVGMVLANHSAPASASKPSGRLHHYSEVRVRDSSGRERTCDLAGKWPVGSEVPLVYLPGRPDDPRPITITSYGQLLLGLAVLVLFVIFSAMLYATS